MRYGIVVLLVGALLITPASFMVQAQNGDTAVYSARGPYAVGVRDYVIEDDERPLAVSVWYPALNPEGLDDAIEYAIDGIPLFTISGHALRDALPDAADGPYPLVVFSHGAGGFRHQSVYLTEHLASYGFVVIASEHPGSALMDFLGDDFDMAAALDMVNNLHADLWTLVGHLETMGGVTGFYDGLATSYAERPLDVLRQIDFAAALTAADGDLAGVIDTDVVAVSGHSFGGYTAMAAGGARLDFEALMEWCVDPVGVAFDPAGDPPFVAQPVGLQETLINCATVTLAPEIAVARGYDLGDVASGLWPTTTDPRIKAVVALAPWNASIFGARGLAAITVPVMVQVGSADGVTPPVVDAYVHYTQVGSAEKALVVFEGADHFLFAEGDIGVDDAVWDMDAAHDLVNHFATAFLLEYLAGDDTAAEALRPDAVVFDGIRFHHTP